MREPIPRAVWSDLILVDWYIRFAIFYTRLNISSSRNQRSFCVWLLQFCLKFAVMPWHESIERISVCCCLKNVVHSKLICNGRFPTAVLGSYCVKIFNYMKIFHFLRLDLIFINYLVFIMCTVVITVISQFNNFLLCVFKPV